MVVLAVAWSALKFPAVSDPPIKRPIFALPFSPSSVANLARGMDVLSLWRWARLSVAVGAMVGLAAAGAYYVLEWAETRILHEAGAIPQSADVPHLFVAQATSAPHWWLILLLPAVGGLIAGLLIWKFAPEAKGHGTDALIDAFHNRQGQIRSRVPLVKIVASLCTLGTGGSGGREGPMAQIGAGGGAWLARILKLTIRERRLLLLAGAAGAISALFRAPLGASIWALEILYRDDFESDGIFPCLISSVTAYSVFTLIYGEGSLFHVPVSMHFHPAQLPLYAIMALGCAPMALLWIRTFYGTEKFFSNLRMPPWLKPALGGLLMAAIGLLIPAIYAGGYGWLQDALRPVDDAARQLPVGYTGAGVLLGIALAKMLATSLTIGSGGSAGVFAPSLFIGGFVGGAFGLAFHELVPSIADQPGAFVLVGMGAFYAGVSHTPLATIILVSEMFGSYELLVPLMLAEMVTLLLLRNNSLYERQVQNRLASRAHSADFTVDVLEGARVSTYTREASPPPVVPSSMPLAKFLEQVSASGKPFAVVRGSSGKLEGMIALSSVQSVISWQDHLSVVLVGDAMVPMVALGLKDDLRVALARFMETGFDRLPVVTDGDDPEVVAELTAKQLFAAYHTELAHRRATTESSVSLPPMTD